MKILVTGAGGTLGRALTGTARAAGHQVSAMERGDLDITDASAVRAVVRLLGPHVVVNCAAFSDVDAAQAHPRDALTVNRDGTRNIAVAAREAETGVVHISTDYVFDGKKKTPYRPHDQPAPLNLYGISKLAGEVAALEAHPRALVLRTSWIFGQGSGGFVGWAAGQLRQEGPPLRIVEDERSRPTWSRDLAQGILELVAAEAQGVHHLANRGDCNRLELAREIREIVGSRRELVGVSGEEFGAPARRPHYSVLDLESGEALLGRGLPHWRESLRRYLNS